jgi:acetolactate synthase regulatory subunit
MDLLHHSMEYSMERPLKTYCINLLVETKRSIKLLDTQLQNSYRIMAAKYTIAECIVSKLLMMGRGTARNM